MSKFESIGFGLQIVNNFYGLVKDMRDNAAGYKAMAAAGQDVAAIRNIMLADAAQYLARLQWVANAVARNGDAVAGALAAFGLTMSDVDSLSVTLSGAYAHTIAAQLETVEDITAESDYILASVPAFERIF